MSVLSKTQTVVSERERLEKQLVETRNMIENKRVAVAEAEAALQEAYRRQTTCRR